MIPLSYNVRSLQARKVTNLLTALGIGLVVFVLATALMLTEGIKRTFALTGSDSTAIVIRKGSDAELSSWFDKKHQALVMAAAGVQQNADGKPAGVGEVVLVVIAKKQGTELLSNIRVRGVTENVLSFRPEVRIIQGRPAKPGTNEVLIGSQLVGRFEGMKLGNTFELKKNRPVRVVGVFESGGSSFESEIWADVDVLRSAFGREGAVTAVRVKLTSAAAFDGFKAAIESDKQLQLEALRESDYYAKQSEMTSAFVQMLGVSFSIFFALGAMIGAAITMHATVAQRRQEIGTLRAIGFGRLSVLGSFLVESLFLALVGGLLGLLGALAMGLVKFSMMNFNGWNEVVFSFVPTGAILIKALTFGGVMGIIGGFFPALRASRVVPAEAIRR
ncbi:MAG: ABC transporter permease [Deltaproteobacteria bacterium]|nr:ABC transporter permease [Deltaproteobacteria bacterium]